MKKNIIYIALIVLFTACQGEDIIDPSDLGKFTDKLVVNAVVTNDKSISLQLTDSKSSISTELPNFIENADAKMSVNGSSSVMVYDPGDKVYTLNYLPKTGDIIGLDIRINGYPSITSSVKIPASINANASLIIDGTLDSSGSPTDLLKIAFKDDISSANYYKIAFFYYNTTLATFIPMAFSLNDPAIIEFNSIKLNDGSILFTDVKFNGQLKTLSTAAPYGIVTGNPNEKYLIVLESVNEDLYRYYTTLQRARDAKDGGFSSAFNNAVVIHTNIKNGLGILGATYASRDTLR